MSDFHAVGAFHERFGLDNMTYSRRSDGPRLLPPELQEFRTRFLREELMEYELAVLAGDLPGAADALIDLVYVALGTAHLHHLPWQELFDTVHRANMQKVRAANHPFEPMTGDDGECKRLCGRRAEEHSTRGREYDVVKPKDWLPPDVDGELRRAGWRG